MLEFTFPREDGIDLKWVGWAGKGGCNKKRLVEYIKIFI